MRTLFLLCCFSLLAFLGCIPPEDEDDLQVIEYPRIYTNQDLLVNEMEVYYYDSNNGELSNVRSMPIPAADERTVVLLSETRLSDTQHPVELDYEYNGGCIVDGRDYQRMVINQDSTRLIIDNIIVSTETGISVTGVFECQGKTDQDVIEEAVAALATTEVFDSIYVARYSAILNLQE